MSRFVYIAALFVCVGLVAAEGEQGGAGGDSPNPAASLESLTQGLTQKIMQQLASMNSAANCPAACAQSCELESEACIDIPDVLDCKEQAAYCASSCDELCSCLAGCQETCGKCASDSLTSMVLCMVKSSSCMGQCEAKCPANELNEAAKTGMAKGTELLSKFLTKQMASGQAEH